jgi:hypothetical protein
MRLVDACKLCGPSIGDRAMLQLHRGVAEANTYVVVTDNEKDYSGMETSNPLRSSA